jgi:hypothetical protein
VSKKLYERVFTTLSDSSYFPGLWALLNSIYVYHGDELRVFVFSYGLTDAQLARLEVHPLTIDVISCDTLPFSPAGAWEAKQQIMGQLIPKARCVYLLDCDLVLTSRVDDVFALAETGKIVSSTDGAGIDFGNAYRAYGDDLSGQQQAHLNSGALCLDVQCHWALVGLWAFCSQYGSYSPHGGWPLHLPGHGDQGMFNALCAMLGKQEDFAPLGEAEWCDCTAGSLLSIVNLDSRWELEVRNGTTGNRQRLVHSSGPKWWTQEGREHLAKFGDKYGVFTHFAELIPMEVKGTGAVLVMPNRRILVGVCSHGKRETWMRFPAENVRVVFFSGKKDVDEEDVVVLACPDDYASLPSKVQAFFRYAIEHEQFDYLFKCDDDTYVVQGRLALLVSTKAEVVGDPNVSRWWFSGGAGYLMSRPIVELFATAKIPPKGAEDLIFSKVARAHKRKMKADSRLRPDARIYPMESNELITAHRLNPEGMREAHQTYCDSLSVVDTHVTATANFQ